MELVRADVVPAVTTLKKMMRKLRKYILFYGMIRRVAEGGNTSNANRSRTFSAQKTKKKRRRRSVLLSEEFSHPLCRGREELITGAEEASLGAL